MMPGKCLHTFVLSESQFGVQIGGVFIAFLCPLPKLPAIIALKRGHVFLGLVNKNAIAFFEHLIRAHGHSHFNFFNIPFLPGAFIKPKPAVFYPVIFYGLDLAKRLEHNIQAHPVGSVWIGQVGRAKYLVGPDLPQQVNRNLYVLVTDRRFFNRAGFIKGKFRKWIFSGGIPT